MFTGIDSPLHWLVLAVIALIVLGPKRLPDFGRSLGKGMREFKDSISGVTADRDDDDEDDDVAQLHTQPRERATTKS